jgi:hypothetical protein
LRYQVRGEARSWPLRTPFMRSKGFSHQNFRNSVSLTLLVLATRIPPEGTPFVTIRLHGSPAVLHCSFSLPPRLS